MSFGIRDALPEDAARIAAIHAASLDAAYRGRIPDHLLDVMSIEDRVLLWRAWLADPEAMTLLRDLNGHLAGFCTLCASRDVDATSGVEAEIPTLYIDPACWRAGHGAALCRAAVDRASALGFAAVTLWVLDINESARDFYATFGFTADGATKEDDGPIPAPLLVRRYRLDLPRAAAAGS